MNILRSSFSQLFEIQRFACVAVPAPYAIESSWRKIENNIDDHLFLYQINSTEEGEAQVLYYFLLFFLLFICFSFFYYFNYF